MNRHVFSLQVTIIPWCLLWWMAFFGLSMGLNIGEKAMGSTEDLTARLFYYMQNVDREAIMKLIELNPGNEPWLKINKYINKYYYEDFYKIFPSLKQHPKLVSILSFFHNEADLVDCDVDEEFARTFEIETEECRPAIFLLNESIGEIFPWRRVRAFQSHLSFKKDVMSLIQSLYTHSQAIYLPALLLRIYRRIAKYSETLAWNCVMKDSPYPFNAPKGQVDMSIVKNSLSSHRFSNAHKSVLLFLTIKMVTEGDWHGTLMKYPERINEIFIELISSSVNIRNILSLTVGTFLGELIAYYGSLDEIIPGGWSMTRLEKCKMVASHLMQPNFKMYHYISSFSDDCLDVLQMEYFGQQSVLSKMPVSFFINLPAVACSKLDPSRLIHLPPPSLHALHPTCIANIPTMSYNLVPLLKDTAFSLYPHGLKDVVAMSLSPSQVANLNPQACAESDIHLITPSNLSAISLECLRAYLGGDEAGRLSVEQWAAISTKVIDTLLSQIRLPRDLQLALSIQDNMPSIKSALNDT